MYSLRTPFCLLCVSLMIFSGCSTPPEDRELTKAELRALLSRPKDARSLYLTVFEGPSGPEFENAHRLHPGQAARQPFVGPDDQPCILHVNGSTSFPLTALIDPSTPESWAPVEMRNEIPLTPIGPPYYQVEAAHLSGNEVGYLTHASVIKLDGVVVDSVLFSVRDNVGDLGPFARSIEKPTVRMVLGHQFLQAFKFVRLDYPERTTLFSASQEFPHPGAKLLAKVPLLAIQGALGTRALVNGRETKVLLDLAGNYTAAVPAEFDTEPLSVYLGDIALRLPDPVSAESQGLAERETIRIGWQALKPFIMTLDYERRAIWFERP